MAKLPDKKPTESARAYQAFADYCRQGAARSLSRLLSWYEELDVKKEISPPTLSMPTLKKWSYENDWGNRALEYNAALDAEYEEQDKNYWADRKDRLLREDYELGDKLRKLATQALDEAPKFIKSKKQVIKGTNGQPDKEIITIAHNINSVLKALELSSRIQRSALGLPSVVTASKADVTSGGEKVNQPLIYLPEVKGE